MTRCLQRGLIQTGGVAAVIVVVVMLVVMAEADVLVDRQNRRDW